MSMLNPNQKQIVNQFQSETTEQQAQEIANFCNQNGITKEQLGNFMNILNKK